MVEIKLTSRCLPYFGCSVASLVASFGGSQDNVKTQEGICFSPVSY